MAARKTHLDTAFLFPPELDLAELALTDCVAENVIAELGVLLPLGVVMATSPAATGLLAVVNRGHDGGRGGVVEVVVVDVMWLGHGEALSFSLNVLLGLRNQNAVKNFARFPRGAP